MSASVVYWATYDESRVNAIVDEARGGCETTDFRLVVLEASSWSPWAPFSELVEGQPGPSAYFRHRHLFRQHSRQVGSRDAPEPLVDEELAYERGRLADSLIDRLVPIPGQQRLLFIRHAEFLSTEALSLVERYRDHPQSSLSLHLCFEAPSRNPQAFGRLDTLGYITWVGTLPLGLEAVPTPAETRQAPTAAQRELLLRWMCFETLALTTDEDSLFDRLEALAALGGFEEGIDLGEALVRRQTAAGSGLVLRRLWSCLARLYRQAGDPASAARCLTLGWKQARDAGDRASLTHFDFLLFETSYRALVVEDVYLGLEDRLTESLETLGWFNHLAFVFTKNVWVQTLGRTRGWEVARAVWSRGNSLVRRLGNHRRLAVVLQTLGSLQAIDGDLAAALVSTRRAIRLARVHSSALHTAKVENGLGYLYFSAGDYRRAWVHHSLALGLLPETRDHQEYIGTLVNLGRLYLFNNQPTLALPLLTTVVRVMDGLGLADLPFHSRANTWALLAVCCLKTGQGGRGREFLKKLQAEEELTGRSNEHRACLEVLVAEDAGDVGRADAVMAETLALLTPRSRDLRHLLAWILMERGRWRAAAGDLDQALHWWNHSEAWLHPAPLSHAERAQLQALRTGGRPVVRLAPVIWDSPLLIRFTRQEAALRALRRTVQDYGFLQRWHQELVPGMEEAELFRQAVILVRTHFPVETVAILGADDRALALAPGSDPEAARTLDSGFPLVEVFPLVHSGKLQARLVCIDTHPEPIFGPHDARVLALACDHLSLLLLSQRKALDLEERSTHLARALEVLRDTQERLVRSENLAVLGKLSAGLAHELNTPLGAILSASRTLQDLHSGPLAFLWKQSLAWTDRERQLFDALATRLVGRPAVFLGSERSERRLLEQSLERRGVVDPRAQAEAWFELGLGGDTDLIQAFGDDPSTLTVLERLVPVAQGHRLAQVVQEAAQRAGSVVASLRSSLQGTPEEALSEFGLFDEFQSVLAVLGAPRWRGLTVEWALEPGFRLRGKRHALGQVWTNLIQNAVQAMGAKGTLTLGATRSGSLSVIEIIDSGPGISLEHQTQILQLFFSTKKATGGLGLGLDLCRRILEAHHGRLEFESQPGHTVFRVLLPW